MGQTSRWRAPPGWRALRQATFAAYGHACWRCGAWAGTVDHVVAVALGGTHALSNLRPACQKCNSSTGASLGNRLGGPRGNRRRGPRRTSRDW